MDRLHNMSCFKNRVALGLVKQYDGKNHASSYNCHTPKPYMSKCVFGTTCMIRSMIMI